MNVASTGISVINSRKKEESNQKLYIHFKITLYSSKSLPLRPDATLLYKSKIGWFSGYSIKPVTRVIIN